MCLWIFRSAVGDHGFSCSQAGGVVECFGGALKGTASEFYPPLGATGAKLTTQLVHELGKRGGGIGLVTMCIGGGMGAAGLFEVHAN